ncbi:MAG TPA: hypothetical protein VFO16_10340 [Pseudonocardiaceae bacterium]|nr:hypothetical protein [Pseudonocardiaceae bacterium]
MPAIPESTKTSLAQRLRAHARETWPQLSSVHMRYRGPYAYIDGQRPDGQILPLMRLRYGGSATRWGFAIYQASSNSYQDSILPTGTFAGSPQDALDCACNLYLTHPDP